VVGCRAEEEKRTFPDQCTQQTRMYTTDSGVHNRLGCTQQTRVYTTDSQQHGKI
jgi:pectin methylesterase-like acyl-CoA thioesterase